MQKISYIIYSFFCFLLGFSLFFILFHSTYFLKSLINNYFSVASIFDTFLQNEKSFVYISRNSYKNFYGEEKDNQENKTTNLLFVGDIMLDRGVKKSVVKNFNGDFRMLFDKVDFLKKADILFGNLEGPISDKGKDMGNLYSFRMNPSSINAIYKAGFQILSISNNHMGDWGIDAFIDTIERLKEKNILFIGGGLYFEETINPVIIEKNGIRFGFLSFSDVGPRWLKIKEEKPGILIVDERISNIIKEASLKSDFLIVSFHFGEEYKNLHSKRQEYLAHLAIDNGAKIVIGHHPHVIQDTEFYKEGFIAYSLGNFIFDQSFSKETMTGLVLEVSVFDKNYFLVNKKLVKINNFYQPELIETNF